jgi:hypothetical protein
LDCLEGDAISVMALDSQQQLMLERLRVADDRPVMFAALRADGVRFPATVASELELGGVAIERVYDGGRQVGVRLRAPRSPRLRPTSS